MEPRFHSIVSLVRFGGAAFEAETFENYLARSHPPQSRRMFVGDAFERALCARTDNQNETYSSFYRRYIYIYIAFSTSTY